MSDVGGGLDLRNVTLTFDSTVATSLPNETQIVAGTYRPTNTGSPDSFGPPAPAEPYGTSLTVFNGISPNGTWQLFVVDDEAQDLGSIASGWELSITTN